MDRLANEIRAWMAAVLPLLDDGVPEPAIEPEG
jgi:hypothetical protein